MTGIRTGMIRWLSWSLLLLIGVNATAQDSARPHGWKVRAVPASGPFFEPPGVPPETSPPADSLFPSEVGVGEPGSVAGYSPAGEGTTISASAGSDPVLLEGWDEKGQRNSAASGTAASGTVKPVDGAEAPSSEAASDDLTSSEPGASPSENASGRDSPPGTSKQPGSTDSSSDFLNVRSAVVDGPIDRLALANNLYATGQITLALEMYEQIDQSVLPLQERHWIEYQMACCLRKLKRIPEAQAQYRRLAAQPEARLLNEMSRWWLDRIADRITLENDIQELQKKIDTVKETQRGRISAK